MSLNVEQLAVNRIWTLLERRTGFTTRVEPQNRIKTSRVDWAKLESERKAPADFPYVGVQVVGNTTAKPTMLLGYDDDVDYPIEGRIDIEIRMRFQFQSDTAQLPLEAEIDAALLGGGIDLGLPWVRWITTRKTRRTSQVQGEKDLYRTTVIQTVSLENSVMASEFA